MSWLSDNVVNHLRSVVDLPDLSGTKYRCIEKIASGGMATVYLAEDTHLRRKIALKILNLDDETANLAERMRQEAFIIAALEHPSIVPIHDVGTLPDGRVFYTMKYVKGDRLDEHVRKATSLPERLRIFQKICEGVAFAHAQDVIHRDLKPENIMVGDYGEVLVMDWGLAKVLSQNAKSQTLIMKNKKQTLKTPDKVNVRHMESQPTQHGTIMGTPAYMAPEQERGDIGQIDQRTDIYALGTILRFVITTTHSSEETRNPDSRKSGLFSVFKTAPHKIPKQLEAIVQKARSSEKSDRYSDALELVADVENYLDGFPVSAYRENVFESIWRWLKQYRFLMFLIMVYIFVRLLTFFLSRL
ncbi:serine/threonine protein kinase [candidate division KSB1 bacterium]|nr:serine/threonine protein kinase [candidate division KSB1 bacterium]NIR72108.1 serine/threonine protein kinase [candidate division KSB1 bacterium]NIS26050.1 serine/threonine protein kinase [candidate division KSB1 bacterium]NIT71941.1 serine/threonine protein kinase [candidate division KSB1 bacterium]NIU25685.1 serine/threonine protein kinase [candidate division KSB1 bacterium]